MTTNRPYTAVRIEYVPAGITQLNMTAKKRFTIPGKNGGSVTVEAGERFTVVRASSLGVDMWYIVRHAYGVKKCSCPAAKPCKHEKAVCIKELPWPFEIAKPSYPQSPTKKQLREIADLDAFLGRPPRNTDCLNEYQCKLLIADLKKKVKELDASRTECFHYANTTLNDQSTKSAFWASLPSRQAIQA